MDVITFAKHSTCTGYAGDLIQSCIPYCVFILIVSGTLFSLFSINGGLLTNRPVAVTEREFQANSILDYMIKIVLRYWTVQHEVC
jgi:hypothetical protein